MFKKNNKIEIMIAEPHGFCGNENFGVRRAIKLVQEAARQYPNMVYLLGEVVHNWQVIDWLEKEYGVKTVHSLKELARNGVVIIRAHGATPKIYKQAKKLGLIIIDATCPLVVQVHQEVKRLVAEGKKILYLVSDKNHDEAVGVAGEAPAKVELATLEELDKIKIFEPEKTVILTQTTLSILETKEALEKLKRKYPGLTIKPHICLATTQRQEAIIKLSRDSDLAVIVGSTTSSNSNRLKDVAEKPGAKAYIVDKADNLQKKWFTKKKKVVVSSGASTPEWVLDEVIKKIKNL